MKINLESMHAFNDFPRSVLKAMEIANEYGSSTLTLTFTSIRSGTAFDISSEIIKPEIKAEEPTVDISSEIAKPEIKAEEPTVDITYVLDNIRLIPDLMPIGDLISDKRIYRSLKRSNINTAGDLKERLLDSISDERYSAFGYPLFTIRNLGICSAQKVLAIMTETIDAIKACHILLIH